MSMVIVPVGLSMGQDFAAGDPAHRPLEFWQVHLGGRTEHLTLDETRAWGAAFLHPDRHVGHEIDRGSLQALIREQENSPADPATVVSRLLERGLLVEFDPVDGALEATFGGLQLFPLVQGFGNSPEDPASYSIGLGEEPLVEVEANIYALWSYAMTEASLWDACVGLAEGLDEDLAPGEEPFRFTPEEIARQIGAALPVLVTAGCAFLDPATGRC